MKTFKKTFLLIGLFAFGSLWSQQEPSEEKKVIKEVDQVNRASDEINQTATNTTTAVKSTVANTKETLKEVGSLFGSGTKKNTKSKGVVEITIQQIDYDNEYLNQLYQQITKQKGVKKPTKVFSNGKVVINVNYKEGADALWQRIPKQVRSAFKMTQMETQSISLQLGETKN